MQYAQFSTYEDRDTPVFMTSRTYQMAEPAFFAGTELLDRGASQMQVLIVDEQNREVFSVIGSFVGGSGDMDFMEILVESVQKLAIDTEGELEYIPHKIRQETTLSVAAENVLTVDTEVSNPRGLIQERAEEFTKELIQKKGK